jgi:hypothetical protein
VIREDFEREKHVYTKNKKTKKKVKKDEKRRKTLEKS